MQPTWVDRDHASAADLAACRAMLQNGSKTFAAASLLLPQSVRGPATALYAFCRDADDAVDLSRGDADVLGGLRHRLLLAYEGRPLATAVDRALADVVGRFAIPPALLEALIEGFAWDAAGRRYEDLPALRAYAARVAGTVGAMMTLLMGVRDPEALARACDLGVAMQLSNIARDVGEDAAAGRLYLPLRWMREAGIDPEAWLTQPSFSPALGSVVNRLLVAAEELYRRAGSGVARLPPGCRPAIQAARLLYAEIGRQVERGGLDSVSRRAVVSKRRKLGVLVLALASSAIVRQMAPAPALPETQFLVDAVQDASLERPSPQPSGVADRVVWVLDLFERLERRGGLASGVQQG